MTMLAAGAVASRATAVLHVNSVTGSDAGRGTAADPLLTITHALKRLAMSGGGTVIITAPEETPLTEMVTYAGAHDVRLTGPARWYMDGTGNAACLWTYGLGRVTLERGTFKNASTSNVLVGYSQAAAGSGRLVASDCEFDDGGNGLQTQGIWTSVVATDCKARGNTNDGFNFHATSGAPVATLTRCEGSGNGDEGASPHETVVLHVNEGSYTQNGAGGLTAVDSAVMHLSAVLVDGNQTAGVATNEGGVTYLDAASGSLTNVTSRNNAGPGVSLVTSGSVTVEGLTSGVEQGNGQPDVGV